MKIKLEIKSIYGDILFSYEKENNTIKETVEEAIKQEVDLNSANLNSANLRSADLSYANLRSANLNFADLSYANLSSADLRSANLNSTNLRSADLSYADLSSANLSYANLNSADLRSANLRSANLSSANLSSANLENLYTNEKTAFFSICCPEEGAFIGYKQCQGKLVTLQITKKALRSSATTLKCRCSEAKVLHIEGNLKTIKSNHDASFVYTVGKIVKVDDFDTDRWNECSTGIHFFMNKKNAHQY